MFLGGSALRALGRLAWRDLRRVPRRTLLTVAALAISIAALTGVRGAQRQAQAALSGDLRLWLGGDLAASTGDPLDAEAIAALDALGIRWTLVRFGMAMLGSDESPDSRPGAVKVVDPQTYPLYPSLALDPPLALAEALAPGRVAVSPEVLEEFRVRVGDTLRIAGQPFRIAAVIRRESDRFNGFPGVPMRVMVSREAWQQAGMARPGSAAKYFALYQLPVGASLAQARAEVQAILPGAAIADYQQSSTAQTTVRGTVAFLGVTAILVLAVSAAGLLAGLRQHVREQTALIAILKTLGAGTGAVALVFLCQVAVLLAAGFALGIPLGLVIRDATLRLMPDAGAADAHWLTGMGEASVLAIAALGFAFPPVVGLVRRVRPLAVLRESEPPRGGWFQGIAALAAMAGLLLVAIRFAGSWASAGYLLAALVGAVILTTLLAAGALRGLARLAPRLPFPMLRLGLRTLTRTAAATRLLIATLAMGLLVAITTFGLHRAVAANIVELLPFDEVNLFVAGFEAPLRKPVLAALRALPGASGEPDLMTQARLRLTEADGKPVTGGWREVGCLTGVGKAEGAVAAVVETETARQLGLRVGSRLAFTGQGGAVQAEVVTIRSRNRVERFRYNSFTLECGRTGARQFHIAAIRVGDAARLREARRAIAMRFADTAVFTVDDLNESILRVSGDALTFARVLAGYAIAACLCILAAVTAAFRQARVRELAILAALGASRGTLLRVYAVEFAATGVLAAAIAALLSSGLLSVLVSLVLERPVVSLPGREALAALPVAVALSLAAGWLPLWRSLSRRPLESLRE